ncbi:MAG TPA: thiamine phosphate synthase, partial [Longimicrobiales bacterium]|nr:thiamine phosphate synthase [Longimicrobiales bacterium]
GRHSLPIPAVRSILPDALLAWSAHGVPEAVQAARAGADFIVLGTIWATASHPGREPAGIRLVERAVRSVDAPVVAIGGVTPERAASAVRAGGRGVAVLRGVWQAKDPVRAAGVYLDAMTDALRVSATPAGRKHD